MLIDCQKGTRMQNPRRSYQNSSPFLMFLGLLMLLMTLNACAPSSHGDADDDTDEPTSTVDPEGGDKTDDDDITSTFDPDTGGTVEEMVALINEARAHDRDCGSAGAFDATAPVTWDDLLGQAALRHATDMATHSHFDHTGTDGSSAGDRITDAGYVFRTWGENIAVGQPTVEGVVNAWLGSPGHCANIMRSQFTQMGAAGIRGAFSGFEAFYWTLNFATPG
jgi:uncharacterized protein YkwD